MKRIEKTILISLGMIFMSVALAAEPLSSWNHEFNPSLMSTGNRKYFEMGGSTNTSFSNSYLALTDIFQEEFLIDFNDISEDLDGKNMIMAMKFDSEFHSLITIKGVSIGDYATVSGVMSSEIPGSVFDVFADGILIDEAVTGEGNIYSRVFSTAGLYGGYRWKDWQFGVKGGAYMPLVYTADGASFSYYALAQKDGTIEASGSASIPLYSSYDMSGENGVEPAEFANYLGYNLDLGASKVRDGKPIYGFHLTGITLVPAMLPYEGVVTTSATTSSSSLINFEEGESDPWTSESTTEVTSSEGSFEVTMPLAVGGFYRLEGYPGFVDWIGYGEFIFEDEDVLFNGGVTAQGAVFPLSALSLSLGYDRILWETLLGLRFNLRAIEMGVDLGLSNTRIDKIFSTNGLYANLYMGIGW